MESPKPTASWSPQRRRRRTSSSRCGALGPGVAGAAVAVASLDPSSSSFDRVGRAGYEVLRQVSRALRRLPPEREIRRVEVPAGDVQPGRSMVREPRIRATLSWTNHHHRLARSSPSRHVIGCYLMMPTKRFATTSRRETPISMASVGGQPGRSHGRRFGIHPRGAVTGISIENRTRLGAEPPG
jgi:hypothetical protein